jgi:hypothetical protein
MSAVVDRAGRIRSLDRKAEPGENLTEEDVKDTSKLVKLLLRVLADLAGIRRRWWPRHIDFEDVPVDDTGTTKYRFPHNFGGRVRWWVVDQEFAGSGPFLDRHADTDGNTLVLVSFGIGTMTLRVEEAG